MKNRRFSWGSRGPAGALLGASLLALSSTPAAADMTLNVEKLSSNGMEVRSLSCKLESGGFLGAVVVVGLLAKYKDNFNKCAPGGAAFATKFTWKGSKTTDAQVTASSEPKQEACVAAVLKGIKPSTVEGTCTAIVLTGKTAKAEAAAEALRKKQ